MKASYSSDRMLREKEEDYFVTDVKYWLYNRVLDYFGEWSYAEFDMSEYPAEVRKWFRVWKKRLLEYREENGINDFNKVKKKVLNTAVKELEDISKRQEDMDESRRPRGRMLNENHRCSIIFRQYRDINGISIGYVDDEVAFEAVKMLNKVMKFIEENGGETDGNFTVY